MSDIILSFQYDDIRSSSPIGTNINNNVVDENEKDKELDKESEVILKLNGVDIQKFNIEKEEEEEYIDYKEEVKIIDSSVKNEILDVQDLSVITSSIIPFNTEALYGDSSNYEFNIPISPSSNNFNNCDDMSKFEINFEKNMSLLDKLGISDGIINNNDSFKLSDFNSNLIDSSALLTSFDTFQFNTHDLSCDFGLNLGDMKLDSSEKIEPVKSEYLSPIVKENTPTIAESPTLEGANEKIEFIKSNYLSPIIEENTPIIAESPTLKSVNENFEYVSTDSKGLLTTLDSITCPTNEPLSLDLVEEFPKSLQIAKLESSVSSSSTTSNSTPLKELTSILKDVSRNSSFKKKVEIAANTSSPIDNRYRNPPQIIRRSSNKSLVRTDSQSSDVGTPTSVTSLHSSAEKLHEKPSDRLSRIQKQMSTESEEELLSSLLLPVGGQTAIETALAKQTEVFEEKTRVMQNEINTLKQEIEILKAAKEDEIKEELRKMEIFYTSQLEKCLKIGMETAKAEWKKQIEVKKADKLEEVNYRVHVDKTNIKSGNFLKI